MSCTSGPIVERSTPRGRRREIDVTDRHPSAVESLAAFHGDADVWLERRPGLTLLVSESGR